ncbi:MAG: hypothetical protein GIW95_04190 [Candidatus Eremiobacteraeota bacterium]|nr:hypothetical protein [Candidatus Eremiobacteraeota bacterium]
MEQKNQFCGTPLDQTLWTIVNQQQLPNHEAIIESLLDAGANVSSQWLEPAMQGRLPASIVELLRRVR